MSSNQEQPSGNDKQFLVASGILLLVVPAGMVVKNVAPTVLRVAQQVFFKGVSTVFVAYAEARSKYRWKHRVKTPTFLRPLGDWVFTLSETASVDCPKTIAESVKIVSAVLNRKDMQIDVSKEVQKRLDEGLTPTNEIGKVTLYMDELVGPNMPETSEWSLEVIYKGHADPTKRIPSAEFGVKYIAKVSSPVLFPPYRATDKIRKGLTVNKVLHARTFHEKNLTPLAKKYAGLNANFYEDVTDTHVQKNHIDHKEVHVILSQRGQSPTTVVVTRKDFASI